jgi:hypothetical protein
VKKLTGGFMNVIVPTCTSYNTLSLFKMAPLLGWMVIEYVLYLMCSLLYIVIQTYPKDDMCVGHWYITREYVCVRE